MSSNLASLDFVHTIWPMSADNIAKNTLNIDASGLSCPMPLVLLKKAISEVSVGDGVQIDVTDIHAELDFEIWCERFGHRLERLGGCDEVLRFLVVKGS